MPRKVADISALAFHDRDFQRPTPLPFLAITASVALVLDLSRETEMHVFILQVL